MFNQIQHNLFPHFLKLRSVGVERQLSHLEMRFPALKVNLHQTRLSSWRSAFKNPKKSTLSQPPPPSLLLENSPKINFLFVIEKLIRKPNSITSTLYAFVQSPTIESTKIAKKGKSNSSIYCENFSFVSNFIARVEKKMFYCRPYLQSTLRSHKIYVAWLKSKAVLYFMARW